MNKTIKCPKCGAKVKDYIIQCSCGLILKPRAWDDMLKLTAANNNENQKGDE
jgi:hypothetical protein